MVEKNTLVLRRPQPSSRPGKGKRKRIKWDKGSLLLSLPFRRGGMLNNLELFHFFLFFCFYQTCLGFHLLKKRREMGEDKLFKLFYEPRKRFTRFNFCHSVFLFTLLTTWKHLAGEKLPEKIVLDAPCLLYADQAVLINSVSVLPSQVAVLWYYLQAAKVITIQQGPIVFN